MLLIEVADSSLRFDRAVNLPLYARKGIPEVWIVDPKRRTVDVHRAPEGGGYAETERAEGDRALIPALAPGVAITLRQIYG